MADPAFDDGTPAGPGAPRPAGRGPWGFWATAGLTVVAAGVFIVAQMIVAGAFALAALVRNPRLDPVALAASLERDGLLLAIATTVAGPPVVAFVVAFVKLRKGPAITEYLGLRGASAGVAARWLAFVLLLVAASDGLNRALGRPVVPEWQAAVYASAVVPPLLWFAILVMAPITEEVLFRGFLVPGLVRSPVGQVGAVVISAAAWAAAHLQYELFDVLLVFAGGLALGAARLRTGSLYVCVAMHSLISLVAMVETALGVR